MMKFHDFLDRVIEKGIAAARNDYTRPDQKQKLTGSVAGFEACRNKTAEELKDLLEASRIARHDAYKNKADDYWWFRCYELEVEWVCNCCSAALMNQDMAPIITPTTRGVLAAAEILGVQQ